MNERLKNISDLSMIKAADANADLFSLLFNNLYDGVSLFEVRNGKIRALYLNERYFDNVGYTKEQYVPYLDNITVTLFEEDEQKIFDLAEKCLSDKSPFYYEARGYRADDSVGFFSIRAFAVDFIMSDYPVFLASVTDISEQKRLEREIAVDRERYRILEETSSEYLFEYDIQEDRMTFSYGRGIPNKMIEHYSSFLHRSPLVHEDDIDVFMTAIHKAATKKCKGSFDYRTKARGTEDHIWCRTYYSSVADDKGNIISILGRIQDIRDELNGMNIIPRSEPADVITGLPGKKATVDSIKKEILSGNGSGFLIDVDIDRFVTIVEQGGRGKGNAAMKTTADVLTKVFHDGIVGRFVCDEFIVYVSGITEAELQIRLDRMLEEAGKNGVPVSAGVSWQPTFGSDKVSYNDLFITANRAMYKAKQSGRSCAVVDRISI